ncbi:NACHT domain-containing NTPase [Streptococcus thoraltensis]|uniref:NACHT domain-containing protein n=1 Tax=Streptococcus thoraltensis TaxID=55085 RepID=UPI0003766880|nr:toll/interleukin-1 receptor domain-containing protein [Streptococcus thoraltensis]MDY4761347.1 toll/interleukin-1 receptor domain-containing protein [Streptococcus thoraltensis]
MLKVFIAHAWSGNEEYDEKILKFLHLLQVELEEKIKIIFDDNTIDKGSLNRFMRENVRYSDVILALCDEYYWKKSDQKDTGVYYELQEIREHNLLEKVIPLKVSDFDLPYDFGTVEYIDMKADFNNQQISSVKKLLIRIAKVSNINSLIPQDEIRVEKRIEIDSLGELSNIVNTSSRLSDIYTYPELRVDEEGSSRFVPSKNQINNGGFFGKNIVVGDRQSGKTSFAKKIFLDLYESGLQPVLLDKTDIKSGNIIRAINMKYVETYLSLHSRSQSNIVVIIDDFHQLKKTYQEKIRLIEGYKGIILFVDEIFDISSTQDFEFSRFVIQPFKPTLRQELIEKIVDTRNETNLLTPNDRLKKIDESRTLIDTSLGLGRGYKNSIIPAFPLYILVILGSISEVGGRLDSPMSSYGHVYQLLISLSFQNCGVQNDKIDSYINFLTYLSKFLYSCNKLEISEKEFEEFISEYKKDYKIFEIRPYLDKLLETGLIKKDNSSYYKFTYDYLYYFFIGKYFAENFEGNLDEISKLVKNLDKDKNGNICIFIAHHSKNDKLIDMLNDSLNSVFEEFSVSTLNREELGNFDENLGELLSGLKIKIEDHRIARKRELEDLDKFEDKYDAETEETEILNNSDDDGVDRQNEIRRAMQTVEVVGVILKNRHGSIKLKDFEKTLKNAVDANLRLLKSFIEIVSDSEFIIYLENYIAENVISEQSNSDIDEKKIKNEIRHIILTMNFSTIFTLVLKTINSIGSEAVSRYFSEMLIENDIQLTPVYLLIMRGLAMQYEKQLAEREIASELKDKEMSNIAVSIMRLMVINHVSRHSYNASEKQRIEQLFKFKPNSILRREQQIKSLEQ